MPGIDLRRLSFGHAPHPSALRDLTLSELHEALRGRQAALPDMKPGVPADMCRYAIERIELEIHRRAG